MKINTKHSIGDTVFFMLDDKVTTGIVNSIQIVVGRAEVPRIFYTIEYDGNIEIERAEFGVFATKQQLLRTL